MSNFKEIYGIYGYFIYKTDYLCYNTIGITVSSAITAEDRRDI